MSAISELPIVDILNVGLSGFCFLMAFLGYFLLLREQKNTRPREIMLDSINSFIKKTVFLGALVGTVVIVLAVIQRPTSTNEEGILAKFIGSLPPKILDNGNSAETVNVNIRLMLREIDQVKKKNKALKDDVDLLESKTSQKQINIASLEQELRKKTAIIEDKDKEIDALGSNFLSKVVSLNKKIPNFGKSINPLFPFNEEKRIINIKIQELLAALNFYAGKIDGDRKSTTKALIAYQKSKGFKKLGFLSGLTTTHMIKDHLGNSE